MWFMYQTFGFVVFFSCVRTCLLVSRPFHGVCDVVWSVLVWPLDLFLIFSRTAWLPSTPHPYGEEMEFGAVLSFDCFFSASFLSSSVYIARGIGQPFPPNLLPL
ncbi:hypothetical protein B0T16DRAFT_75042 [Cercophora newfieldiana]|uniref:Uncharacterized protein n=1 Tax=Cercophora newfieldiana TaxID=92897 RepID=A0AA40CW03_9PEZI|nr:hypothetical protein B0T16DRAFT_75042 [Cercophora newfieldiana]